METNQINTPSMPRKKNCVNRYLTKVMMLFTIQSLIISTSSICIRICIRHGICIRVRIRIRIRIGIHIRISIRIRICIIY